MGRRCCIKSCSNSKKPKDVIHMFPKSSSMKELWIGVVEKLNGRKLKVDVSNYGVCTQHFSPNDYSMNATKNKSSKSVVSNRATRRLLLPSAVPNTSSQGSPDVSTSGCANVSFSNSQFVSVSREEYDDLVKSLKQVRLVLSNRTNKWKLRMDTMKNQLKQLRRNCVLQQQMIVDLQKSKSGGTENTVNPISQTQTVMEDEKYKEEEVQAADGDLSILPHCLLCNTRISSDLVADNEVLSRNLSFDDSNESSSQASPEMEIKMEVDDEEEILHQKSLQQHDHELISFLQTHFNIIITKMSELNAKGRELDSTENSDPRDIFKFCGPCHHQILTYKNLKAHILELQKQSVNLKQRIAYGFNNSFETRMKEMSARRRAMNSEQIDAKYAFIPSPAPSDHDNSLSPVNEDELPQSESVVHFEEDNLTHESPSPRPTEPSVEINLTSSAVLIRPCSVVLHRIEAVSPPPNKPNDTLGTNPPSLPPKPKPKRPRTRKWDNRKGGPFICPICSKSFTTRYKRNLHVRAHSGLKPHVCQLCAKPFSRSDNLKKHLALHSKGKVKVLEPHVCSMCGNSYTNRKIYRRHLAQDHNVTDEGAHGCSLCAKRFKLPRDLRHHIIKIHEGRKLQLQRKGIKKKASFEELEALLEFNCDACHGLSFNSLQLLKEHRTTNHGIGENGEGLLICSTCNLVFISPEDLSQHSELCRVSVHKFALPKPHSTKSDSRQSKTHQCEHCGRVLTTHRTLLQHIRVVHEGERQFQCTVCGERFSTKSSLKLHMFLHTGEKIYGCDYCEVRFNKLVRKKKHMVKDHPQIHLVQSPFVCPICYSTYSTETERDEHVLKLHDKFKCKVCKKAFTHGERLKAHMRIHTGEKPFVCQFCAKAFNKPENLREHCFRHTGERPHKCKVGDCNQGFLRKKELANHLQKVHFNNSEPQQPQHEADVDHTVDSAVDVNVISNPP